MPNVARFAFRVLRHAVDLSTQQVAPRRSRMRRQSAGKSVIVSPRDLLIFRLLARYRYLPSIFLHAFVGGNPIRFKQRLGELFHEGYLAGRIANGRR